MTDLEKAREIYSSGEFTCVLVKGDNIITSAENGIKPLLKFIADSEDYSGFSAADKIVGKAAAFLYAKLGVSAVYAEVLSADGKRILETNGITCEYASLTEQIINRKGDGLCPMELTVKNTEDTETAYRLLLEKVRSMCASH